MFGARRREIERLQAAVASLAVQVAELRKDVGVMATTILNLAQNHHGLLEAARKDFGAVENRFRDVETRLARLSEWRG